MGDPHHRLRELLACRPLTVQLEQRLEHRVRRYADRLNQRLAAEGVDDPYVLDGDQELANVVMFLCEAKLDEDERASASPGVSGSPTKESS
jgi:hypothetical protein